MGIIEATRRVAAWFGSRRARLQAFPKQHASEADFIQGKDDREAQY